MRKRCYSTWPGIDGTSDGRDDEVLGNLNIQVQLKFGELLDDIGIKPTEIFIRNDKKLLMDDSSWNELLQKLGFDKEGK